MSIAVHPGNTVKVSPRTLHIARSNAAQVRVERSRRQELREARALFRHLVLAVAGAGALVYGVIAVAI